MSSYYPDVKVGDKVKCVYADGCADLVLDKRYTIAAVTTDVDGDVFVAVDTDPEEARLTGNWYADRFELVSPSTSAQQKLDQLKKYFESGNNVPVQQATIKAKDFWAIYNS